MKPICYLCLLWALLALTGGNSDNETIIEDEGVYDYIYIQDSCGTIITPGEGQWKKYGFIMADSDGCYDANVLQCVLELNATADHHITLRFQDLSTYCPNDYVIIDGYSNSYTYCGFNVPTYSLYSSSNSLRMVFASEEAITTASPSCETGFKLYYTAYHTGECSEEEFQCVIEDRCIPIELMCDMYDNCGDWSDERGRTCGLSISSTTTGAIVAISIMSAVVGLSLVAFFVYCIYERTKRRKTMRQQQTANNYPMDLVNDTGGTPERNEPPPVYTFVNTVSAEVDPEYEDVDSEGNSPPRYDTVSGAPWQDTLPPSGE